MSSRTIGPRPSRYIQGLLLSIVSVLYDPLLDRQINRDIADQYDNERSVRGDGQGLDSHIRPRRQSSPAIQQDGPASAAYRRLLMLLPIRQEEAIHQEWLTSAAHRVLVVPIHQEGPTSADAHRLIMVPIHQ